jgi:predicted Zn finger-like uncharacterized protein
MIVQCEKCKTRFRLADERVNERGSKVRCSKCTHVFVVTRGASAPPSLALDLGLDLGPAGGLASDLLAPSAIGPAIGSSIGSSVGPASGLPSSVASPYAPAPSGVPAQSASMPGFGGPPAPSARPVAAPATYQAPGAYPPGPAYAAFAAGPTPSGGSPGYGAAPYAPFASSGPNPAPLGAPYGYGAPPPSGSPAMPVPVSGGSGPVGGVPPSPFGAPPAPPSPGLYGAAPFASGGYAAGLQPGATPYGAPPGAAPYGAPPGAAPYGAPAQGYGMPSPPFGASPYAPQPSYAPSAFGSGGFGPHPIGAQGLAAAPPMPEASSSVLELPGFGTTNFPSIPRLEPPPGPAPGEISQLNPAWLGPAASFVEGLIPGPGGPAPFGGLPFGSGPPIPPLASDRPTWGPQPPGARRPEPARAEPPRPEPVRPEPPTAKVEVPQFPSSRPEPRSEPAPRLDAPPARTPREVTRPFEKLKIPDAARPSVPPLPPPADRTSDPPLDAESLLDALNAARPSAPAPLSNPFLEGLATSEDPPPLAPGVRSSIAKIDLQRGLLAPAGAVGTFTNDDKTRFAPEVVEARVEPKPKRPRGPLIPPGSARLVGWIGALVASVAAMVFWRAFTGESPISELAVALLPGPSAGQTRAQVLTTDHGTALVIVRGLADADAKLSGVRVVLRTEGGELARAEAPLGVVYDALELHSVAGAAGLEALRARPRAPQPPRDGKVPWMVVLPLELGLHQVADVRAELR